MNPNQLITIAELKEYLHWDPLDSTMDHFFDVLIDSVSQMLEDCCNTRIKACTVTETLSGDGSKFMILSNRHITSITSLKEWDGNEFSDTFFLTDEINRFINITGKIIYNRIRIFEEGRYNYQITYQCGYAEVPEDLKLVAKEICVIFYNNSPNGDSRLALVSNQQNNFKMFFLNELPRHRAVLDKYTNRRC